jgi:predicted ABC-class ATPase
VRKLYEEKGCSSILVIGGCGSYLDVADLVISMECYRAHDVTAKAKSIAKELPVALVQESVGM